MASKQEQAQPSNVKNVTPEEYAQRRIIAAGALRPGEQRAEIIADSSLNNGVDGVVVGEQFNTIFVSEA